MKILFIGGTKRGYMALQALIESGADMAGIISLEQDASEVERYEAPIRDLALKHLIPHYQTRWMKDRDYGRIIAEEIRPTVIFAVGCRILFPREIIQIPPLGILGIHDSLLPEYRGFAPMNWAILNGEDHSGVSLFYLNELTDGGDIILQERIPIGPDDTAPVVHERVCQSIVKLVLEACTLLSQGVLPRIKQNYAEGSFSCARRPEDGMIVWERNTAAIYNQIRALTFPYPGAFTYYKDRKLFIWSAKPVIPPPKYKGRIPGRVVGVCKSDGSVDVLTGDGVISIFEVQFENEDRTLAANVVRSVRSTLGLRIPDLFIRIQYLEQQLAMLGRR